MGQSIEATKASIGQLLGQFERRAVVIPQFQRSFSWEKAQISTFWNDLKSFETSYKSNPITASYFLGPIVLLDKQTEILLLDGQQRLATATILLSVIRDISRTITTDGSHEGADFARDVQRDLIQKTLAPITYSLVLNELDEPFFLSAIKKDPPTAFKTKLRSHKLLQNAQQFFNTEILNMISGYSPTDAITELKQLKDALTKGMTLIAITVQEEEDAFDIFETLNDRGLRLSVPDLVINLLLKRCQTQSSRDSVRQQWNSIITQMGKRDISRFLRHMWLSQYGDLKSRGLFTEIKNVIETKQAISSDFSEKCANECEAYLSLLDVSGNFNKEAQTNVDGLIKHFGVHNSLPLLLSGYVCLNQNDFGKLTSYIIAIYIRHTLIANKNPSSLESVFYEAAREIRAQYHTQVSSAKCLLAAKTKLYTLNPSDSSVIEGCKELSLARSEANWLLVQIANTHQSKTKEVSLSDITLEHIFPQNAGLDWPDRATLEPYIWHIGNLTLLGEKLNNKSQNKSFKVKNSNYYSKSEIVLTKNLCSLSDWNEKTIISRAEELGKEIAQIWK